MHRALERLRSSTLKLTTMGRTVDQEKEFYMTLAAAAQITHNVMTGHTLTR
jgi:hypothetical protein